MNEGTVLLEGEVEMSYPIVPMVVRNSSISFSCEMYDRTAASAPFTITCEAYLPGLINALDTVYDSSMVHTLPFDNDNSYRGWSIPFDIEHGRKANVSCDSINPNDDSNLCNTYEDLNIVVGKSYLVFDVAGFNLTTPMEDIALPSTALNSTMFDRSLQNSDLSGKYEWDFACVDENFVVQNTTGPWIRLGVSGCHINYTTTVAAIDDNSNPIQEKLWSQDLNGWKAAMNVIL